MNVLAAVGLVGILATVSVPVFTYARMGQAERAAAEALAAVHAAQGAFRRTGGRGGYATELASLTTPCPSTPQASLAWNPDRAPEGYVLQLRAAERTTVTGHDCHGRATAADFYAGAEPHNALTGRYAMATTSRGQIYVFFDGIAPRESDMNARGLAVPLDALATFKIP